MSNRRTVRKNAIAVIDARPSNYGGAALDFAKAVRDLTDAQLAALLLLLGEFEKHPRYASAERYLQAAYRDTER